MPDTQHALHRKAVEGFGLTTAQIVYHLPDYRELLQEFIWQHIDQAPTFPRLLTFLDFWQSELDGKLHSVTIAHARLIRPREIPIVGGKLLLN